MPERTLWYGRCVAVCLTWLACLASVDESPAQVQADRWGVGRWDQRDHLRRKIEQSAFAGRDVQFVTGIETPLGKVHRDKLWFKGEISDAVEISAAKNETESFQLAVIPLADDGLKGIDLQWQDLVGQTSGAVIDRENLNIWRIGYVQIDESIRPSFPGEWPDPLLPMAPMDLEADELGGIWVEIKVPGNAEADVYRGTISVSALDCEDVSVSLKVTVMDFALPEEHVFRTTTWVMPSSLKSRYGPDKELEMFRTYCGAFLEHKISPLNVGKSYYKKDDYSVVDANIALALEGGLSTFEIPRLKGEELHRYCEHLREKNWFDKAMIYGHKDEPAEEDYPAFREDSREIRKVEPDLKIFMAESPHPGLYGAVDVWWASMVDENRAFVRDRLGAGDEVWWYRCGIPVRCRFNRPYWEFPSDALIDRPSIDARIFYWMSWKFGMTPATFFWCGIQWGEMIPEDWPADGTPIVLPRQGSDVYSGTRNGDGWVMYPGAEGPLPSIRLKCIRDGIEDYEYLWVLAKRLDEIRCMTRPQGPNVIAETERLLAVSHELVVDTDYYAKDPERLLACRESIARQILKLQKIISPGGDSLGPE